MQSRHWPSIENGFLYDFANVTISEEDFPKIEEEVRKLSMKTTSQKDIC
jgi:threonyl-tRNA synthetase